MVAVGFLVLWFGYQQAIYGWVLLKGYDVKWSQLANPLAPYAWPPPGQSMPMIPAGQILPGSAAKQTKAQTAARTAAQTTTTTSGSGTA